VCGRYAATKDPASLAAEFDAVDATGDDAPSTDYNVAPTKPVIAVVDRHPRDEGGEPDRKAVARSLRVMRWGLVPHWAKDKAVGSRMINARADSAAAKPAFRTSMKKRRCLIPADGWYEWRRDGKAKQPFYMTRPDGHSIAFAGLWSTWHAPDAAEGAPPLVTCAVITTDAVGQLTEVHDRMPLVLPSTAWADWLDPDAEDATGLLDHPDLPLLASLELRPIGTAVNNVRNNGPHLLDPAQDATDLDEPALFDAPS
jgi:putative SOS response-associated peptidase YedK